MNSIIFFEWGLGNNNFYKCRFIVRNLLDRIFYSPNNIQTKIISSSMINNRSMFDFTLLPRNLKLNKVEYKVIGSDLVADVFIRLKQDELELTIRDLDFTLTTTKDLYQGVPIRNRVTATLNNNSIRGQAFASITGTYENRVTSFKVGVNGANLKMKDLFSKEKDVTNEVVINISL